MLPPNLKLCLVTQIQNISLDKYEEFILKAIQGGVTAIQLRAKGKKPNEVRDLARRFKALLRPFKVPLIIHDHIKIAKEVDADGVHVGQCDVSPLVARQMLGPEKIIGLSIETFRELEIINKCLCVNYVAASAVFPSKNKANCKTVWEIAGLKKIVAASKYPVIAIGGINATNINEVMATGASGVAVISAIHDAPQPERAATELLNYINHAHVIKETHV